MSREDEKKLRVLKAMILREATRDPEWTADHSWAMGRIGFARQLMEVLDPDYALGTVPSLVNPAMDDQA